MLGRARLQALELAAQSRREDVVSRARPLSPLDESRSRRFENSTQEPVPELIPPRPSVAK